MTLVFLVLASLATVSLICATLHLKDISQTLTQIKCTYQHRKPPLR